MRAYHRLTEEARIEIYALKKAGFNQTEIANQIGVHKTTVSREVRRNTGLRGYRPKQAHRLAGIRQAQIPRARISTTRWRRVEALIAQERRTRRDRKTPRRQHTGKGARPRLPLEENS